jgi:hypothetical protein
VSPASGDGEREARPLSTALTDAAGLLSGDSGTSRRFIAGLVIGALVGAAVAGSSFIRARTSATRQALPRGPEPDPNRSPEPPR